MKVFADYHTHTKYSDGRGRMEENVVAAMDKGLEEIGISDHGPRNIGTGVANEQTYLEIKAQAEELAQKYPQIQIKVGAEADVLDVDGQIDLSPPIIDQLDYLIIGLHPFLWPVSVSSGGFILGNLVANYSRSQAAKMTNENTKALVAAIDRYQPEIVSHPGLKMQVDLREVARACARHDTAYEINVGHNFQKVADIRLAAQEGPQFVIDSDAHFPATVGELTTGVAIAEAAQLSPEQIINVH